MGVLMATIILGWMDFTVELTTIWLNKNVISQIINNCYFFKYRVRHNYWDIVNAGYLNQNNMMIGPNMPYLYFLGNYSWILYSISYFSFIFYDLFRDGCTASFAPPFSEDQLASSQTMCCCCNFFLCFSCHCYSLLRVMCRLCYCFSNQRLPGNI